jgi:hypothetical protein
MWVFGGETVKGITNDLYCFEFQRNRWTKVNVPAKDFQLAPRRDHSAIVFEERMIVYGGGSPAADCLGLIQFNAEKRRWKALPMCEEEPPPRRGHTCALYQHYMLVFGGVHKKEYFCDLWVYDIYCGFWIEVEIQNDVPMTPRAFAAGSIAGPYWFVHGGGDHQCFFRTLLRVDCNEICRVADPTFQIPDDEVHASEEHKLKQKKAQLQRRKSSLTGAKLKAMLLAERSTHHYESERINVFWNTAMVPKS